MRKWIPLYTAAVLLFVGLNAAGSDKNHHAEAAAPPPAANFDTQIDQWAEQLGTQQPFAGITEAAREVIPLGPGLHGWLVTFTNTAGVPIAYMVVHAKPEGGFVLGEYGAGRYPLFSLELLYQALVQQELITTSYVKFKEAMANKLLQAERIYGGPFQAMWKIELLDGEQLWLDAKTGEELPALGAVQTAELLETSFEGGDSNEATVQHGLSNVRQLTTAFGNTAFDPFHTMPWLTRPPIASSFASLQRQLDSHEQVRYISETHDELYLYILPILGYQIWDKASPYMAMQQKGLRFIPLSALAEQGDFYL